MIWFHLQSFNRFRFALLALFALASFWMIGADPHTPVLEPPLDIKLRISGSFGEYRPASRYHHGVDIKTFEQNGIPVHAPLDGFVSRIHTSEYGYGNGLFFSSGKYEFTFGHLNDFRGVRPDLEEYRLAVRILQPDHIAVVTPPPWFTFKKGDQMARTGESGLGAPHLHFEVRENGTYRNPLAFSGMEIPDDTAPEILDVIAETPTARFKIPAIKNGAHYDLASALPTGPVRLLIGCVDTQSALNRNGVAYLRFEVNGKEEYSRTVDSIEPQQLLLADGLYHPTLTIIGKVYYYYLYARPAEYPDRTGKALVTLADVTGNTADLRIEFQKGADVTRYALMEAPQRGNAAHASAPGGLIDVTTYGQNATLGLVAAPLPSGVLKEGLVQAGPSFYLSGRDLTMRDGLRLQYHGQFANASLYVVHPVSRAVNLIGAGKAAGASTAFDFPMYRGEGWIVPLYDKIAPRVERVMLYGGLTPDTKEDRDPETGGWFREYYISDAGSGVRPETLQVLLNGNSYPYTWKADRSVVAVSVPRSFARDGALLSIRMEDVAGNRSDWFLDTIVP